MCEYKHLRSRFQLKMSTFLHVLLFECTTKWRVYHLRIFQYFSHLFPPFFQSTSPPTTVLLSMLSSLFSTQSGRLPFLCFTVGPLIFTPKYLPYMLKSRATLFSTCSTTRSALVGGGGGPLGGVEASLASCVFLIRQAV